MGLCFCHRPSMGLSPEDDERHPLPLPLSALPAAPRPAKLARPGAPETLPVPPSTPPPRAPRLHDAAATVSPRQGSVHCPIPKIPDFEGLADNETDSDDELLSRARTRAAGATANPVPSTPVSLTASGAGGADSTGMSPLSSLISRIGSIGRASPTRPINQSRVPDSTCGTDDLAAAARRAEVRRLTQKMIQEELQSEQMQQPQYQQQQYMSHTYKRSSMSTIKEDPADVSGHNMSHPHNIVAAMDGSGHRSALDYTFVGSREDLSVPFTMVNKGKDKSAYLLPKPPTLPPSVSSRHSAPQVGKVGLPQELGPRGRARGGVQSKGPKDWMWTSFATDPSARRPLPDGASPFAPVSVSVSVPAGEPAKATTETAAKAVFSSSHKAEPGQSSLRVEQVAANCHVQKDKKDEQQNAVAAHTQAASESLSSMDEDGSIHEARKARVVVSGQLRSSSNQLRSVDDIVETSKAETARITQRASSPLPAAVTKVKKSHRKTSESSHISSLDLPPPLVDVLSGTDETAIAQAEPVESTETSEIDSQSLPARNGFKRLPFLSLDRFGFGLKKASNANPPGPEVPGTQNIQESKSVKSLRGTGSGEAASIASFGNQLDGQHKEKFSHDYMDSASAKSQYHSISSAALKNWAKENPSTQSDLTSAAYSASQSLARATTTDIEKRAEEWHQQLQTLDLNSPVRAGGTCHAGLHGNSAKTQRRSISHTYPLSHQASGFWELPQRESAMRLWPNSLGPGNQDPSTASGLKNRSIEIQAGRRRHTLSFDVQQLSDSWWTEPSWRKTKTAPEDCGTANPDPTTKIAGDEDLPNAKEITSPLSLVASQDTVVHKVVPSLEPFYSTGFSNGIEKAIRAGFKKVMYRKQVSTPSLSTLTPAAAVSSRSLNPQCSATVNPSKASSLKAEKSAPESRATTPIQEPKTQVATSEPRENLRRNNEDVIQDIDNIFGGNIFGVLVDMESNQQRKPATPIQFGQNKADDDRTLSEIVMASPQTIPSTSIANAYAEVRAYISGVLPDTPALRLGAQEHHNSPRSSYQEVASHQGSDAVCAITQASVQVTTHKSFDSMSAKSDSAPIKKAVETDTASTKYMARNGRTMPKAPLLKSTVQFSAELENIFQGRKENRKAFQDRTLQPTSKQN